jgi:hypothetical protein
MHVRLKGNLLSLVLVVMAATGAISRLVTFASPVLRTLQFHDDFSSGKLGAWVFTHPEDWEILAEGPLHFLHMKKSREPGVPRRPVQYALLRRARVGSFDLRTKVRRESEAMMIVFNYVDDLHFYYAHLAEHPGTDKVMHNGIFIVNVEPRKRIPPIPTRAALPDKAWHSIHVHRDVTSGLIEVYVDDSAEPYFSTHDSTFTCGQIGLGSFDETGDFTGVDLKSEDAGCQPGNPVIRPASSP